MSKEWEPRIVAFLLHVVHVHGGGFGGHLAHDLCPQRAHHPGDVLWTS
jgi:hypothetical protein